MPDDRPHHRPGCARAALAGWLAVMGCNPEDRRGPGADVAPPDEDPCDDPGVVCTFAGIPGEGLFGLEGEHRLETHLDMPTDAEQGPDGAMYVVDFGNHRVRRVDPSSGEVLTVVGTGLLGDGPPGDALQASLNHPTTVAFLLARRGDSTSARGMFVAAWHNSRVVRVDLPTSSAEHWAGTGERAYEGDGGVRQEAVFDLVSGLAFRGGELYLADQNNDVIRAIDLGTDRVRLVAGTPLVAGYGGDGGPATAALLRGNRSAVNGPELGGRLVVDGDRLLIADTLNGVIRVLDPDAGTIDAFAGRFVAQGCGEDCPIPGSERGYSGDGGDARDAVFAWPTDAAVGPDGRVYVVDSGNHCVRVVEPDGTLHRFAGRCGKPGGFGGDLGPAIDATFDRPTGVSVDAEGYVYVADFWNHVIRRVAP